MATLREISGKDMHAHVPAHEGRGGVALIWNPPTPAPLLQI